MRNSFLNFLRRMAGIDTKADLVSSDLESRFAKALDANTMTCPHGCGQVIRVTDEEAHQSYGCDIAVQIGRGPIPA